ncbi:MAG: LamG-like jellyroll fold domain-containing protein [Myxococcales bacterium]
MNGLVGSGLTLQDDGTDDLLLDAGGAFTFATLLPGDAGYDVAISVQPSSPPQSCVVENGQGVIGSSDVTDVQVDCCVPAPSGMVSWWRFEPPSPGADELGQNDLAFYRYGGLVDGGEVGYAVSQPALGAPYSLGFPYGAQDRTLELWVLVGNLKPGATAYFAEYGIYNDPPNWDIGAGPGELFAVGANDGGLFFTEGSLVIQGPPVSLGSWHHVAVTSSDGGVSLFLDGQAVAGGQVPLDTPPGTSFYLGFQDSYVGTFPARLPGSLDEVSVYDRALSPEEIQAIYAAGSQGKCVVGACRAGTTYLDGGCACTESAAALQSDFANCGQCGNACQSALCTQGVCATFTGAYQYQEPEDNCVGSNPLAGACWCPGEPYSGGGAPFEGVAFDPYFAMPAGSGSYSGAHFGLCVVGFPNDLLGLYETRTGTNGSQVCTGYGAGAGYSGCVCDAGTPLALQIVNVDQSSGSWAAGTLTLCLGPTLPDPSFGGAYELDDPDAGGGCRVANPATAGCSCPGGMADLAYSVLVDDSEAGMIDSSLHFCGLSY